MNETIFVRLLDEGVDVWRPVLGRPGSKESSFWILEAPFNVVPQGESWEFLPGNHVMVKETVLDGETVKVAYERVGN